MGSPGKGVNSRRDARITKEKRALLCNNARFLAAPAFAGGLPPPLKLRRDQPSLRLRLGKQDGAASWGKEIRGQNVKGFAHVPGRTEESAFALIIG